MRPGPNNGGQENWGEYSPDPDAAATALALKLCPQ